MRVAIVIASLATAASAATTFPKLLVAAATASYYWNVTNWSAGCVTSGCYYDFNVSAPASSSRPARPAFLAHCSGGVEGAPYQVCTLLDEGTVDRQVVAELLPAIRNSSSVVARIQVSFQYTDLVTPTTWWNFTGKGNATYNQFVSPVQNFSITPDTIEGVA